MKISFAPILIVVLAGALTVLGQEASQTPPVVEPVLRGLEDVPPVVARVDGHPITRRELVREMVGSATPDALKRIVQRMLVEQEAEKRGVKVTEAELDAQLEIDKRQLPNDMCLIQRAPWDEGKQSFEGMVRSRYQMSVAEYRNQIVRQRLLVKKMIGGDIRPTIPALQAFFTENLDRFQPDSIFRAAHILITPLNPADLFRGTRLKSPAGRARDMAEMRKRLEKERRIKGIDMSNAPKVNASPEWEQARRKALRCLSELRSGKISWEKAVRMYTQDPHDLPDPKDGTTIRQRKNRMLKPGEVGRYSKLGPMVKEFYEGTRHLKAGEIGGPVETKFGYHIVKMLEVKHPPKRTFNDLRDHVEAAFVRDVLSKRSERWLDALVAEADIASARARIWPPAPNVTDSEKEDPDPLIGKVNGKPLRRSAVWQELLRSEGPDALRRLINREMALGPLKRQGPIRLEYLGRPPNKRFGAPPPVRPIEVTPEEIDKELNDDRLVLDRENTARRELDPKAPRRKLDQYLYDRYGQTVKQYRRALEAAIVLRNAVNRLVNVDDATLRMEYALAKENYKIPMAYDVRHILIAVPRGSDAKAWESARSMAEMVRDQIVDGNKDWDDMAAKVTGDKATRKKGGNLGRLTSDDGRFPGLYKTLVEENFEKGQITKPIRTRAGYHIVKVDRRRSSRIPDFTEVQDKIKRDYLTIRAAMFVDVWLRSMENQAKVQQYIFDVEKLELEDYFPLPPRGEPK